MSKILTISVAAYNVEAYIKENIESVVMSEVKDDIEVFVVDDGGKDRTYEIAKEYEKKYPEIVHAVHKENGGYGSVQNYSIAHASGKYFKILDGDDWMDTDGLTMLVKYLKTSDVDAVVTDYYKGDNANNLRLSTFAKKCKIGVIFDSDKLPIAIGMWALTYKTEIIRKSKVVLPEHMLYTDRIFATIPFSHINTVIVLGYPVYCYRTGRKGQSISRQSRINHIEEYMKVTKLICQHYCETEKNPYILIKAAAAYKVSIRALLLLSASQQNLDKIKEFEKNIYSISSDVYKKGASLKTKMGCIITFLRITKYWGYWIIALLPKSIIDF